jgi:uncharacterized protein (DUF927 family)
MENDGQSLRAELAAKGLSLGSTAAAKNLLLAMLKCWPVEDRLRSVDRTGWYGSAFVLPESVIGSNGTEQIAFQAAPGYQSAIASSGSIHDWIQSVSSYAGRNSRVAFAISTAFAAPLLNIVGVDSGGINLLGPSSVGKTTALRAAASVYGPPDYIQTWRATSNGIEGIASAHNDLMLALDEIGQCDAGQVGEAAYMLGNGRGKVRAGRSGDARKINTWRLLFLSTGEKSLSEMMASADRNATTGQEIRLVDVTADAGKGLGLFDELCGCQSGAALSQTLAEGTKKFYGAVGASWLEYLSLNYEQLPRDIAALIGKFVGEVVPANASGQVNRVARRFGLIAAAGECATKAHLTGWQTGDAYLAAKTCFASWLANFGGVENREGRDCAERLRRFIQLHGSSRFQEHDNDSSRINNRAGYVRTSRDSNGTVKSRTYMMSPSVFRTEICNGTQSTVVERQLLQMGLIEPSRERERIATQKPFIPAEGNSIRLIVLTQKAIDGEESSALVEKSEKLVGETGETGERPIHAALQPPHVDF